MSSILSFPTKSIAITIGFLMLLTNTTVNVVGQNGESGKVTYSFCGAYLSETFSWRRPAIGNGLFITVDGEASVRATDLGSVKTFWTAEVGGTVVSDLVVLNETVYLVTNSTTNALAKGPTSSIRAFSLTTGLPIARAELSGSNKYYLGTTGEDIIAIGNNGTLTAFDASLGHVKWTREFNIAVALSPLIADRGIVLSFQNGQILVIDPGTGDMTSEFKLEPGVVTAVPLGNGRLLIADERGNLERTENGRSAPLWRFKAGAGIYGVEVEDQGVYAASLDNFLYRLSGDSGSVIWRRRVPNRLIAAPLVLGNSIYTAGVGDTEFFIIESSSGRFLNRIPLGDAGVANGSRIISDGVSLAVPVSGGYALFSKSACREQ